MLSQQRLEDVGECMTKYYSLICGIVSFCILCLVTAIVNGMPNYFAAVSSAGVATLICFKGRNNTYVWLIVLLCIIGLSGLWATQELFGDSPASFMHLLTGVVIFTFIPIVGMIAIARRTSSKYKNPK